METENCVASFFYWFALRWHITAWIRWDNMMRSLNVPDRDSSDHPKWHLRLNPNRDLVTRTKMFVIRCRCGFYTQAWLGVVVQHQAPGPRGQPGVHQKTSESKGTIGITDRPAPDNMHITFDGTSHTVGKNSCKTIKPPHESDTPIKHVEPGLSFTTRLMQVHQALVTFGKFLCDSESVWCEACIRFTVSCSWNSSKSRWLSLSPAS